MATRRYSDEVESTEEASQGSIINPMNPDIARTFFDECERIFSFLVNEYDFAPCQQINTKFHFVLVTFVGKNLAIECILDDRESDIDCKIARLIEGKITPYYAVDDTGMRMREGLASLLRRRGIEGPLFRRVTGLGLRDRIYITLSDFSIMLRKHAPDVLKDSWTALE